MSDSDGDASGWIDPPTSDSPAPRHAADVTQRRVAGRTEIADRALEKIVARTAADIDDATGTARQFAGIRLGRNDAGHPVRASATAHGGVVEVALTMSVRWPASVREVTRRVRAHVAGEVARLTGMSVAQVDIEVSRLPVGDDRIERRVQ